MLYIPPDRNAEAAVDYVSRLVFMKDYKKLGPQHKSIIEDRIRSILEAGDERMARENGTFKCESDYAFINVVESAPEYKIYRCDGGHHFGIVFVEHKEREGSSGNERKIVIRNGEMVIEEGLGRNEDQLELD